MQCARISQIHKVRPSVRPSVGGMTLRSKYVDVAPIVSAPKDKSPDLEGTDPPSEDIFAPNLVGPSNRKARRNGAR